MRCKRGGLFKEGAETIKKEPLEGRITAAGAVPILKKRGTGHLRAGG